MKSLRKFLLLGSVLLAMTALLPSPSAFAADATASTSPAMKKATKFPFNGKIKAVDASAMTFTLDGKTPRVFCVTAETKIMKNGAAATLKDAAVGDDVGGYTEKGADGKLTALSVRFGPKPGAKAKTEAAPAGKTTAAAATTTTTAPEASATPKAKHAKKKAKASPSPSVSPAGH